jgi:hypothetical protein
MSQQGEMFDEKERVTIFFFVLSILGSGAVSVWAILGPAQSWAIDHGILVTGSSVLLGWGPHHVGLDLGRVLVGCAIVLVLLVAFIGLGIRARGRERV